MAKGNVRKLAARATGRPLIPNFTVVAGAAVNTNIALTGAKGEDVLLAVLRFDVNAGNFADVSDVVAETAITSDGNVQLTTTDTTGDKLLVIWLSSSTR
jgi:hypothetical protein